MRRQVLNGQYWMAGVCLAALAMMGLSVGACSNGTEEGEVCTSMDDCEDGEICEDEVCVEPEGDIDCELHEDCPSGMLCEDGDICVEDEGEIACTSQDECPDGRFCEDEICVIDPFGPFAEPVEIEDEHYFASFLADPALDSAETEIWIVDNDANASQLDTGNIDCGEVRSCTLSEDQTHLIIIDDASSGDGFDVLTAPVDVDSLSVQEDPTPMVESVTRPRVRGNGVKFRQAESGTHVGYFQAHDGAKQELVTLHDVNASLPEAYDFDPTSERILNLVPSSLDSLNIYVSNLDGEPPLGDILAHIDGSNRPGDAGSLFVSESSVSGFSEDGRFVAYATSGPNDHEFCSSDSECSQTGHVCGTDGRCVAVEPTVHVIDMAYADKVASSAPCTSHDDCGPVNRCDSGSDDFDGGVCQPQRIPVGLPVSPGPGCEATRNDGSFAFTDIEGPITFGPDHRVYFVGQRHCIRTAADPEDDVESDIPRTAILAGDLTTGEYEEIYGNLDGEDYSAADCSGDAGTSVGSECYIFIDNARLSPRGNELVFMGSNPTVSPGLAENRKEIWRVRRDGTQPMRIGGLSGAHSALEVAVHAGEDESEDDDNQTELDNQHEDNGEGDSNGDDD